MVATKINKSIWPEFSIFLANDRKLSQSDSSRGAIKSRFKKLVSWFESKDFDFNRKNFLIFIQEMKDHAYKDSYINKFISMSKHLGAFVGMTELQDFTYFQEEQNLDIEALTSEEVVRLANVWIPYKKDEAYLNKRQQAMILIQGLIGARPGEMVNLRWDDLHETSLFWYITFKNTKTKKQRKAPIGKLGELIQELPRYSNEFVFTSYRGKPLSEHDYSTDLKRRGKACGLEKKVWPHLLRHSAITEMLDREMEVTNVSALVGHADPRTTMRYKHTELNNLYVSQLVHPILANEMDWDLQAKRIEHGVPKLVAGKNSLTIQAGEGKIVITIVRGKS